jgi:hypothetical protein
MSGITKGILKVKDRGFVLGLKKSLKEVFQG